MSVIEGLKEIVGAGHVLTGADTEKYGSDWMGRYIAEPIAVVRPGSTEQVSRVMALAHDQGIKIVPIGGNTGLTGATYAEGAVMLSLERLNKIREIRADARLGIVEAGVILSNLHDAAEAHGLVFPLTFGARGSAMIGGALSTNAGGSNVVRYGSTRGLCLGLEVVLADGRVMDLMSQVHKDNTGYDLKDLFIGGEGTLGVITAAVVKLFPKPQAYATAMIATPGVPEALRLLNRLQAETGGAVEAFEFMAGSYIENHLRIIEGAKPPFEKSYDVNIMLEVAATSPRDAAPAEDGSIPVVERLEQTLADLMEEGAILDAVLAKTEEQRRAIWKRREDAAEVGRGEGRKIGTDICVPTDKVAVFLERMEAALPRLDPGATDSWVCHLGDGNLHYAVFPATDSPETDNAIVEHIEGEVLELGGSFSAEHGVGLMKKASMARRKDPVALDVMRKLKAALDPNGVLNPGKVLPD
ncbi:FAD dependent oxidoreductase [Candidatus Rhodobacter oscarellae]|uniref:FAD dependent oxidoreductase n=1 Tax=Candidatus Rhodobacter oscarellae TaxID=1675527 RepID=A0A0J9GTH0_9RHOB|nr:FAD-binding oxidoreductase [Candidatus Rhodobacter lobularis]KMW56793.1 FAD dependent oxidoreductase [Candidatus Rhodobacter lobularis]